MRHRPLCATVSIAWMVCISWNLSTPFLDYLGVFPQEYYFPDYFSWHCYILAYGFYGLPLTLILLMNFAVVITIYNLKPNRTGQVLTSAKERVCLTQEIFTVEKGTNFTTYLPMSFSLHYIECTVEFLLLSKPKYQTEYS